jgi:hypothetical protein
MIPLTLNVYPGAPLIISLSELEHWGCRLLSSLGVGAPRSLIGPGLVRRHGPTFVRGHVEGKGVYRIVAEDYAGEGAVDVMIDSGAAVSCCSLKDTKPLRYDPREIGRTARAAGGALLEPLGVAKLNLCFRDGGTVGPVGGIWPWPPIGGRGHFSAGAEVPCPGSFLSPKANLRRGLRPPPAQQRRGRNQSASPY